MSHEKRRIVTTIETHEVWIIRKASPEVLDETLQVGPPEMTPPGATVSPSSELTSEISQEGES